MPIGRYLLRSVANDRKSWLEKLLGSIHVSLLTQLRINQIAVSIDGTIEVTPFPMHFEVGLIHVSGVSCLPTSLGSELIGDEGSKPRFPIPDRFMGKRETAGQEHFREIA